MWLDTSLRMNEIKKNFRNCFKGLSPTINGYCYYFLIVKVLQTLHSTFFKSFDDPLIIEKKFYTKWKICGGVQDNNNDILMSNKLLMQSIFIFSYIEDK